MATKYSKRPNSCHRKKSDATKAANNKRKKGFNATVRKKDGKYCVHLGGKKKKKRRA